MKISGKGFQVLKVIFIYCDKNHKYIYQANQLNHKPLCNPKLTIQQHLIVWKLTQAPRLSETYNIF